jgi:thymidylate kinase
VSEVTAIIPAALDFPQSSMHARNNEKLIFDIECMRINIAKMILDTNSKSIMILDRSILSTIIISLANAKRNGWDNVSNLLDNCIKVCETKSLLPNLIIHLDTEKEFRVKRHLTRNNPLNKDWIDDSFNDLQNEYYEIIYSYLDNDNHYPVIRLNGNMSPDEVFFSLEKKLHAPQKYSKNLPAKYEQNFFMLIKENVLDY